MAVCVDYAWSDGEAVKFENSRVFRSELAEFFVGADGGDFSVVDEEGLGDRVVGVHSDDVAVEEEEVGGLSASCAYEYKRCEEGQKDQGDSRHEPHLSND